jgi:lipopolysaccharide transport system ATP-binding protein
MDSLTSDMRRTVLFVSHSMASVASFCPRAIRMDQGRIVDDGASGEVISRYYASEHTESGTGLGARRDRLGSGVLRFTEINLQDDAGRRVSHVKTGEPITLAMDYECQPEFAGASDLLVNVVFSNSKGVRLFGVPSDATRQTDGMLYPKGRFLCRLPEVPLLPGNYEMDIACIRNRELADKIMGAAALTVVEGDPYGTGALPHPHFGDVVLRYSWAYEPVLQDDGERLVTAG